VLVTPRPGTRAAGGRGRIGRLDVAVGLVVLVLGELEVWIPALGPGGPATDGRGVLTAVALVAGTAVAVGRLVPLLALAVAIGAGQAQLWLTGSESVTGLAAVLLILFALGLAADRGPALVGLAVAAGWVLLAGDDLADHAFAMLLVGGPWLAGRLVRGRQALLDELSRRNAELEAERGRTALLAAAEERARIARDVHDVVAHSLTVMIVQTEAAEAHLTSPRGDRRRAIEALGAAQRVGRRALAEVRQVVGALAEDGAAYSPPPTPGELDALVGTVRDAGLPVTVSVTGARRELPPGVDLTVYRVVQEALTNVVRHSGATSATVRISYRADEVEVEVTDAGGGEGPGAWPEGSGGRGLLGMRQRVEACGGRLLVDAPDSGGFAVAACFPAPDRAGASGTDEVAR
jgi:signal transduction histidine kinase